jgi:hypothetical protein
VEALTAPTVDVEETACWRSLPTGTAEADIPHDILGPAPDDWAPDVTVDVEAAAIATPTPDLRCAGMSTDSSEGWILSSCSVKLNSGGNSLLLGSRVPGSRNSLKNGWPQAWRGVMRDDGVYSNSRDTNSMASGGVRVRNTCYTDTQPTQ